MLLGLEKHPLCKKKHLNFEEKLVTLKFSFNLTHLSMSTPREVVYLSDKHSDKPSTVASKRLLDMAGVAYRKFVPRMRQITIDFDAIDHVPAAPPPAGAASEPPKKVTPMDHVPPENLKLTTSL